MKNKILYLLTLAIILTHTVHAAEKIDYRTRLEISQTLTRIVGREVMGADVRVQAVKETRKRVQIYTSVGLSYYPFREANTRAMVDSVRALLPRQYAKAAIELYSDQREVRTLIPMAHLSAAARAKLTPFVNRSQRPLVERLSSPVTPSVGLLGRHIALWQSHGRYFDQAQNRWRWQRVRLWETCEDLYTQSYVLPYLVPMLENAGAYVMLPRERDVQKHEVIVDNDVADQYTEHNGAQSWQAGGVGFAHRQMVYHTGENPFRHGVTRRSLTITEGAESAATWCAMIPERGEYALYVSYESLPNSTDDALYTVRHAGGESRFAVNQTMGGGTWIYLGHFLFMQGAQDVVTLSNRSKQVNRILTADAVKIGGGYGNVARSIGDSLKPPAKSEYRLETSGYPRFCEGSRYWLQWAGFGEKVYTPKENQDDYKDDYMSRANWVNALMGGSARLPDSVGLRIPVDMALAFHSDAGVRDGDEVIGTLGICFTRENKGRFEGGADRYRSRDLTDLVMTSIVDDIRRTWEPEWRRRGIWNRSYFEARVPSAPTMLLELLSHQNFADMRLGSDPRFKFLVSRAIYKGVLRFISSQYGTPYIVQPLPVEQLSTTLGEGGAVTLRWAATIDTLETTAQPTGYVVYTRVDDGGFDSGRQCDVPRFEAQQEQGRIYSYKVTATNDGGESFPSEIVAAYHAPSSRGEVLIVNGFDRISAPATMACDSLAGFCREVDGGVADRRDISFVGNQRVFDRTLSRVENDSIALGASENDFETDVVGGNSFDYPYLHGRSIAAAGYSFSSAARSAVERGSIDMERYAVVDMIMGLQRATTIGRGVNGVEFKIFTTELQGAIRRLLAAGGALFVSGSYVAADLWEGLAATDADRAFAREVLHYDYDKCAPDPRGRVRAVASRADFSRGEYTYHTDFDADRYRVVTPDALRAVGEGAFPVLRYAASGRVAGVASSADGRTFVMGYPFEALTTDVQRDRLMGDILRFLNHKR